MDPSPEPSVRRLAWGRTSNSSVKDPLVPKSQPLIPKTQDPIFFPVPEGLPTELSQGTLHWMVLILILQLAACILRGVYVEDLIGCFWFAAVFCLGAYAVLKNMRMNNIGVWGCACCVNVAFDIVSFVILYETDTIDLAETSTIIRVSTPFPQILGALYAWYLWHDYAKQQASLHTPERIKTPSPYGSDLSLSAYRENDRPGSDGSFAERFSGLFSMCYAGNGKAGATVGQDTIV